MTETLQQVAAIDDGPVGAIARETLTRYLGQRGHSTAVPAFPVCVG